MNLSSKLKAAKNAVTSAASMNVLKIEKNSPHILFGVGMVGFGATVVLASKATIHLEEQINTHESYLESFDEMVENEKFPAYTEKERSADIRTLRLKTVVNVGKLYAPALLVGVGTVICLTKSHQILTSRNVALTAAYVTVDQAFKRYRERVVESYGEEVDRHLNHEFEVVEVKDDNGKVVGHKTQVNSDSTPSMYAKFFQEGNKNWNATPEWNITFLRQQQNWLNDKLQVRGHVFLNEVYDQLGLERTPAGQAVGWLKRDENGNDNYIHFGIFDMTDSLQEERMFDFVTGRENKILLDFNVDGVIYNQI